MIQAEHFYVGVNVVLGLACVVSIFLAFKFLPATGVRTMLIAALVLLVVSGATLAYSQHILRMSAPAFIADLYGVTEGAFEKVGMFGSVAAAANLLEAAAIALCVLVVKKLMSLRTGKQSEGGAEQ